MGESFNERLARKIEISKQREAEEKKPKLPECYCPSRECRQQPGAKCRMGRGETILIDRDAFRAG